MGEWGREEGLETPMPGPLRAILPPPMAAALILGLGAGCAGVTTGLRPQADVPAATAPGAATAGAVPQAAAVAEPSPPEAPPPADVVPQRRPRQAWYRIPVDRRGGIAEAWLASNPARNQAGLRRSWIVLNLAEPIRLPETGGTARSAAVLADYSCARHAWHPVQTLWFRGRDATGGEVLRDRPRGPDEWRQVQEGTLIDVFLHGASRV
jgi:hypothetical protein